MPKVIDFAKVQKELIQNAFQVFVEKGYYQTKLSDIAQRSNLKRTSFYSYFKNKDALYEETILYLIELINETILSGFDPKKTLSAKQANAIHQRIEQKIGFRKLFQIFMEFLLMATRGEVTLSSSAKQKIQSYLENMAPYTAGIKQIAKSEGLSQAERLHYSLLLAFPEKFILPEKSGTDPLFPQLALTDSF